MKLQVSSCKLQTGGLLQLATCNLQLLARGRRNFLLLLLGACGALCMPPVFAFPLLIPAFAGLAYLAASAPSRARAFWDGWWWGLGFFACGLYWMCIALLTEPEKFAWLIPFTLIGLNGLLALFPAVTMVVFHWLKPSRAALPMVFAALWMGMEWARGHVLTGFPWNLPGYAWAFSDSVSQSVAAIGVYGLSFITVLAACAPLAGRKQTFAVWGAVALMALGGAWRLAAPTEYVEGVSLRLVQGNVAQHHKWNPELQMRHFGEYMRLTLSPGHERVTHVIWPETAIPFVLNREPRVIDLLRRAAPPGGALLAGTLRGEGGEEDFRVWNSLMAITREEGISAGYDKHHLVPFGEFVPLRRFLPEGRLTPAGSADFMRGPGPAVMHVAGLPPFSPLICYEAIFPWEAAPPGGGAAFLLNVTNDAWFGASSGPHQHFHMARFRAIEQGVPLIRAANTGISAAVDAMGRVAAYLPLNTVGALDTPLPAALPGKTIYARIGDALTLLLVSSIFLITGYKRVRAKFAK